MFVLSIEEIRWQWLVFCSFRHENRSSTALTPERGSTLGPLLSLVGASQPPERISESFFRVSSLHSRPCGCHIPGSRAHRCHFRSSRRHPYNRAAHWSGQTEAQLFLWTPEIYASVNIPITVSREVDTAEVDYILNSRSPTRRDMDLLERYVHFDFDVEMRLREIGWRFWDAFKPSTQPAEIRARNDSGRPSLRTELVSASPAAPRPSTGRSTRRGTCRTRRKSK